MNFATARPDVTSPNFWLWTIHKSLEAKLLSLKVAHYVKPGTNSLAMEGTQYVW